MEEMDTESGEKNIHTGATDGATAEAGPKPEKENYTMMMLLRSSELRIPLIIAIMLQIIQQLSGINAVRRSA